MDESRRRALIQLAAESDIALIEDTPYRRVRFDGESAPMLKALDRTGAVFHLGTFSKLVAPGLRIGWVAAEADMIARLIQLKSDGGSSPLRASVTARLRDPARYGRPARPIGGGPSRPPG